MLSEALLGQGLCTEPEGGEHEASFTEVSRYVPSPQGVYCDADRATQEWACCLLTGLFVEALVG